MSENEMEYRGSKSRFYLFKPTSLKYNVVKEQRVDGNWSINPRLIGLRCILRASERNCGLNHGFNVQQNWNFFVKIPSKQFDLKKFYTSPRGLCSCGTLKSNYINPGVWSGLIYGEGSFNIIVDRDERRKLGWRVQFKFQIALHIKDLNLLYLLQQYLGGVGSIYLVKKRELVNYSIDSINYLNKLIFHLEKYPLLTQKAGD